MNILINFPDLKNRQRDQLNCERKFISTEPSILKKKIPGKIKVQNYIFQPTNSQNMCVPDV